MQARAFFIRPLFFALVLHCAVPAQHTPDQSDSGTGGSDGGDDPFAGLEDEVLVWVNLRRSQGADCGTVYYPPAAALHMDANLRLAARRHSQDMADQNYFSHTSLDGQTFDQRIRAAGYTGAFPWGENIAAGSTTPASTVELWMNSPGHCSNIMSPSFRAIGVGYGYSAASTYHHYWTQDFGGS